MSHSLARCCVTACFVALVRLQDPVTDVYFAKYFAPEWCDAVLSSLRNLVSVVFQQTPRPALLQFDRMAMRLEECVMSDG